MQILEKLQEFKFSIRLSIISLFVILLSIVGFTIIGISYFAINKILSTSATKLIEQTSLQLKDRIHLYLSPLNRDLLQLQRMLNTGVMNSDDKEFDQFLADFISTNSQIYMIYYGKSNGDYFGAGRKGKTPVFYQLLNSTNPPTKQRFELNANGEKINVEKLNIDYDPRTRPWYQKVLANQKPSTTGVYQFTNFDNEKGPKISGITAAVPIYDQSKKLTGVVGMNLTLNHIQSFISNLDLTKNSIAYIRDKYGDIIAFTSHGAKNLLEKQEIIKTIKQNYYIPISAMELNKTGTVYSFKYKGENFFLVHQAIPGFNNEISWYITIIVPANDILGPLITVSIHALILTLVVLLIGTMLAHYISQKISNPIRFVANESKEITKLNLKLRPLIKTRIKEISYLDESLIDMCLSLLSFQRYVPSSLILQLIESGKIAQVGGESQEITVLFSDIKNFTSLSEVSTPKQIMRYLSDYFQSMTDSVIKHQGTLDKYIGDAIMALWNAPFPDEDHALHACQSAVDMLVRLKELNKRNAELSIPAFTIRIGIDSGEAVVGNVGSEDRLSFTALGDTVNLANRIEELNKIYKTHIIVGESTYMQVTDRFPFRLLDEVAVRGKKQSTTIYELITAEDIMNLSQHKEEFFKAFSLYQYGEWEKALALFKTITLAYPDDYLGKLYVKRCESLLAKPIANWDGIWRA